ncbi:PAS domain-containing sensor histidine kinase [Pedobacter caeni]|uniref:histidine kinase n=1 Tax=Pedobacter caeni TaxID=288992 RepID=A0A1M4YWH5_9SPHI|nr:PAS domain S-box protein [Pedobacter caeni]SHF10174.1 PAS domain S-box-containing protein [Pedobacter caeni]
MRKKSAFITIIYIALGAMWLNLGSNWIEKLDKDTPGEDMSFLYDYKNIIFMVVSGIILFLLIEIYRRNLSSIEKNYKQLFEGSIAAIYVVDRLNYQLLDVNEIMVRKYGYSRKELLGMTVLDLRPYEERAKLDDYLGAEHTEGRATGVWLHQKKNGDLFHMLISHHRTVYQGKPAYTVIAIDIEKHVKAEERIKELLDVYETVTSVTNDVIWEYCPHTDELRWMNGFTEIFGYGPDRRENTREWILSKIHPEDRERVEQSMETSLAELSNSWRCEYQLQCADGTYKYVSNQAFILLDKEGQAEKMVGALRDITIRKNYEQRLLRKNQMLKDIAWNNSHELRRPVSNIVGILDLLKADAQRNQTDLSLLEMLERSAVELDEIITKINRSTKNVDLKN